MYKYISGLESPFFRNAIHDGVTKSKNCGNFLYKKTHQHILIWFCLWSKMALRSASAVRVFENSFCIFPFFLMNAIVPRGLGIWYLIEDLQCKLGQFRVWANGASRAYIYIYTYIIYNTHFKCETTLRSSCHSRISWEVITLAVIGMLLSAGGAPQRLAGRGSKRCSDPGWKIFGRQWWRKVYASVNIYIYIYTYNIQYIHIYVYI